MAMVLYGLYQWISTEMDAIKYLVICSIGAGLFVHSGFQLIALEIIYCLGAWMLGCKKIRCLSDLMILLVPSAVYFSLTLLRQYFVAGMCLLIGYIVLCVLRYNRKVYHHLISIENILIEHSSLLMYVLVPGVFLVGTFIIPFSSAPARTVISISWRGEEQIIDSYLEKIILDGRPVFHVTIAG